VLVFVSNGDKVIMRSLTFEHGVLQIANNDTINAPAAGGEVSLTFLTNVECEAVIPNEAKNWISVAHASRAVAERSLTLLLEANNDHDRSTVVTIKSLDGKLKIEYTINQEGSIVVVNNHEAVDLGLSVIWSTCNFGANSCSEVGGYYLWGDPSGNDVIGNFTAPYINSISGTQYDIVRKKWGGNWRIPTMSEYKELYSKCTWIDSVVNNVSGIKIIGPNGNSIFLPKTGIGYPSDGRLGSFEVVYSNEGYYMTGESYGDTYGKFAYVFNFKSAQSYNLPSYNANFILIPIRAVVER
jgi:hypothetical protein